jgi:hypothetical protein
MKILYGFMVTKRIILQAQNTQKAIDQYELMAKVI